MSALKAGLLSAVVATFTVQSSQWLDQSPAEVSNIILQKIYSELNNKTLLDDESSPFDAGKFEPSRSNIRINIFWFSSILCSLSAALLGLLCQQWIYAYGRISVAPTSFDYARLRQMRFQGFETWKVEKIIITIPIIIQISVLLFFTGILDFVWSRGYLALAIPCTAVVSVIVLIQIVTTMLPAFYFLKSIRDVIQAAEHESNASISREHNFRPCAYKSPQSWAFQSALIYL
jgi:hypothetical protein